MSCKLWHLCAVKKPKDEVASKFRGISQWSCYTFTFIAKAIFLISMWWGLKTLSIRSILKVTASSYQWKTWNINLPVDLFLSKMNQHLLCTPKENKHQSQTDPINYDEPIDDKSLSPFFRLLNTISVGGLEGSKILLKHSGCCCHKEYKGLKYSLLRESKGF